VMFIAKLRGQVEDSTYTAQAGLAQF